MNSVPDKNSIGDPFNIMRAKPMYIGGTPQQHLSGQRNKYLGCIRNVEIVNYLSETKTFTKFPTQMIHGNVSLSVCPTI